MELGVRRLNWLFSIILSVLLLTKNVEGFSWTCDANENNCKRVMDNVPASIEKYPSMELCKLVCDKYGPFWPKPSQILNLSKIMVKSSEITFINGAKGDAFNFLQNSVTYFNNIVNYDRFLNCSEKLNKVKVILQVTSDVVKLNWQTNETYLLEVIREGNMVNVLIAAETVFGIRHGLETLLQLVTPYPEDKHSTCFVILDNVLIIDKPVYRHRGLLIDTARNYISVDMIKKNIDGLAASKMNVLHWHATDTQSFPLELLSLPNMTKYGAYSNEKVYSPEDVNSLIEYGKLRGVRIILEIDGPSHAGSGWEWGPEAGLGNLSVCINEQPWQEYCIQPPCGQLNPANPKLYTTLETLFKDVVNYFPNYEVFHIGGDEVFIPCWNSTKEIIDYLDDKPRTTETFLNLWSDHQNKTMNAFDSAVGNNLTNLIVWNSLLTEIEVIEKYLSKDRYIIQAWVPASDSLPMDLLNKGYRLIISTKDAWYLDHGFWGTTVYHTWRNVYDNKILLDKLVLGGEVCLWGELVDDNNIETKIWPRAAAAAERLWSNPNENSYKAESRFFMHRQRLIERGLNVDALDPEWCVQNEGDCMI